MSNQDITQPLLVRKIYQVDRYTLGIEWTDGVKCQWRLSDLQRSCQCAKCVDEWTNEQLLDPNTVDDNALCLGVESVGRYALLIKFTSGCTTGIYTFQHLRSLCKCS